MYKIKISEHSELIPIEGANLEIDKLTGAGLIAEAGEIFTFISEEFIKQGYNQSCFLTHKTRTQAHKVTSEEMLFNIFFMLPGSCESNFFSQRQITEFCRLWPDWLPQQPFADQFPEKYHLFFLAKKDENEVVGSVCWGFPTNLFVVHVYVSSKDLKIVPKDFDAAIYYNFDDPNPSFVISQH